MVHLGENIDNAFCTFSVGQCPDKEDFLCNKSELGSVSMVFGAMFCTTSFADVNSNHIQIPDIEPKTFKLFLNYLNTNEVTVENLEELSQLLYLGKKYIVDDLTIKCLRNICKQISVNNIFEIYEMSELYSDKNLTQHCLNFINQEANAVLRSRAFLDINLSMLKVILKENDLNIRSEVEIFNACVKWCNRKISSEELPDITASYQRVLGSALKYIRFLSMTPVEFSDEGPGNSLLLTAEEKLNILMCIVSDKNKISNKFSSVRIPRKYVNKGEIFHKNIFTPLLRVCDLSNNSNSPKNIFTPLLRVCGLSNNSNSPKVTENKNISIEPPVSVLEFSTDKDILLVGFQIASRCRGERTFDMIYKDEISWDLLINSTRKINRNYKFLSQFDACVNLYLPEPVPVEKIVVQEATFSFKNAYTYNVLKKENRASHKKINDVKFNLDQSDTDGLILSILFIDA